MPISIPCDLCDENDAVVRCTECDMNLCIIAGCDHDLHTPTIRSWHIREKLLTESEVIEPVVSQTTAALFNSLAKSKQGYEIMAICNSSKLPGHYYYRRRCSGPGDYGNHV